MGLEVVNEERRAKRRLMKELGLKTGKQYRKWVKNQRKGAVNGKNKHIFRDL